MRQLIHQDLILAISAAKSCFPPDLALFTPPSQSLIMYVVKATGFFCRSKVINAKMIAFSSTFCNNYLLVGKQYSRLAKYQLADG
jgi:hypothetical protein